MRDTALLPKAALLSVAALAVGTLGGCRRANEVEFVVGPKVLELDETLQTAVTSAVREQFGTPSLPTAPGLDDDELKRARHGRDLYQKHCRQCHGTSGDGEGPAAAYLYPRPRDYRSGTFKFTTTPYGAKPRREDLLRTVDRGVPGTSMPSFRLMSKADREAMVDYVLLLTHRGELESRLVIEADFEEEIIAEDVPDLHDETMMRWEIARTQQVHPLTVQPVEFTAQNVADGKKAFLSKGCAKCHGEDGRGMTKDNIGKDSWGFATKAADLTSGLLHGGSEPIDVYRRISSGINGTPMPGFRATLQAEPETLWNLVAYVLHVSNQRRTGAMPEPGSFRRDTPESGGAAVASTASE